jgi:GntR family transcriptional regulator
LPKSADERITARKPTTEEAAELSIGTGVPVLLVERVAHDEDGRPVELLRVIGAADRIELVYSDLPIGGLT